MVKADNWLVGRVIYWFGQFQLGTRLTATKVFHELSDPSVYSSRFICFCTTGSAFFEHGLSCMYRVSVSPVPSAFTDGSILLASYLFKFWKVLNLEKINENVRQSRTPADHRGRGEGVKKCQNVADVLYWCPLIILWSLLFTMISQWLTILSTVLLYLERVCNLIKRGCPMQ